MLQVVFGLLGSMVAGRGPEFVVQAIHSIAAAAVEAEMRPMVVEADQALQAVAMLVVVLDAVVAEPKVVADGILAEPVEPKGVEPVFFAGVVAPMVVEAENVAVVVPMGPEAAVALVGLEADPKLVAFVVDLVAHEGVSKVAETVFALEVGPRVAEHLSGLVLALEADPRMADFEGSNYLWDFQEVPGFEPGDGSPMVAVQGTDLEKAPEAVFELEAKNL